MRVDTRSLETASAATLGLNGLVLVLPASTFGANPTAFAAMSSLPESLWGVLIMAVGLTQAYAVARNDADTRRRAALLAVTLYAFLAVLYFMANPANLGTPTWGVHAAGNLYVLYQMGRQDGC